MLGVVYYSGYVVDGCFLLIGRVGMDGLVGWCMGGEGGSGVRMGVLEWVWIVGCVSIPSRWFSRDRGSARKLRAKAKSRLRLRVNIYIYDGSTL